MMTFAPKKPQIVVVKYYKLKVIPDSIEHLLFCKLPKLNCRRIRKTVTLSNNIKKIRRINKK